MSQNRSCCVFKVTDIALHYAIQCTSGNNRRMANVVGGSNRTIYRQSTSWSVKLWTAQLVD